MLTTFGIRPESDMGSHGPGPGPKRVKAKGAKGARVQTGAGSWPKWAWAPIGERPNWAWAQTGPGLNGLGPKSALGLNGLGQKYLGQGQTIFG